VHSVTSVHPSATGLNARCFDMFRHPVLGHPEPGRILTDYGIFVAIRCARISDPPAIRGAGMTRRKKRRCLLSSATGAGIQVSFDFMSPWEGAE